MTVQIIPSKGKLASKPLRVAAYCRVSTESDEQRQSFYEQQSYYDTLIRNNPEWSLVGIYADNYSGRSMKKRMMFQKMITDCQNGQIDLIITKSISRFSRNTVDLLKTLNLLKEYNTSVHFELENLQSDNPSHMLLITIYGSLYQNESQSKSQDIKWGFTNSFREGASKLISRPCYGYVRDDNNKLKIVKHEAEIIRYIFSWHEHGYSLRWITKQLESRNIASPRGGKHWSPETIRKILKNEKYGGNVILRKTFVSDYFTGRQVVNRGQLEKFLITDNHPSIVDPTWFVYIE